MTLTPAQRTALRGMAAPVLLCRLDAVDAYSKEPFAPVWFVWAPREYSSPEYWTLTPKEGLALVVGGLVEGLEVIELQHSTVTTYRITEAGRAAVDGKIKTLRKRKVVTGEKENGEQERSVLRGTEGRRAPAEAADGAVQATLPI